MVSSVPIPARALIPLHRAVRRPSRACCTRRLAEVAATDEAKRFICILSVKVNGERTGCHPFSDSDEPRPEDAYGVTKFEAERALRRVSDYIGMSATALRLPLVYVPGVRENFLTLIRVVGKGVALPLGSIESRRGLIYVGNLVSAIVACVENARAAGQMFLLSDGHDLSTRELV